MSTSMERPRSRTEIIKKHSAKAESVVFAEKIAQFGEDRAHFEVRVLVCHGDRIAVIGFGVFGKLHIFNSCSFFPLCMIICLFEKKSLIYCTYDGWRPAKLWAKPCKGVKPLLSYFCLQYDSFLVLKAVFICLIIIYRCAHSNNMPVFSLFRAKRSS